MRVMRALLFLFFACAAAVAAQTSIVPSAKEIRERAQAPVLPKSVKLHGVTENYYKQSS